MSLYGALFSGVAGLNSQSNKLGVISDNVSNVNTVGFKGGSALFRTLVTTSGATSAYSPGGVLGDNRQLVSKQGLLQGTSSATDIAISGGGLFVVNQNPDGTGQVGYTRAGSFLADSTGNFRNASGLYLQGWPLDRDGRLPGEAGNTTYTISSANLGSLRTVNVQNLTGSAAATSTVSVGANLNASQAVFPGAAGTITMDALSTNNFGITAKSIIVPSSTNSMSRGDKFTVSTGNGLNFTYRYGGFTFGRNVTDASSSDSGATLLAGTTTLSSNPFAVTAGSNVVTVTHTAHGLVDGAVITLSGNTADISGIPASEFNGRFIVDVINANSYRITTATSARASTAITANSVSTTNGANAAVTVDVGTAGLFSAGQTITIAGSNVVNGVTVNGTHTIASVSGTNVTFNTTTTTPPTLAANAFRTTTLGADPNVTVNVGTTNTYAVGQNITIAGATSFNGVNPNGTWVVTNVSGTNVSFTATGQTATSTTVPVTNPITTTAGANPVVTLNYGSAPPYVAGQTITITGASSINGVNPNGTWTISSIAGNNILFTATGQTAATGATIPVTNPISTTVGVNPTVTVNFGSAPPYTSGQSITIAGATAANGANINGTWTVATVVGNNITFTATGQTSATTTVPVTDPITTTIGLDPVVTLNYGSAPPYITGQSITIAGASNVNSANINGTWVVSNVSGNNVQFTATGVTTSGVAAAGGGAAVTTFQATNGGAAVTSIAANGGGAAVALTSNGGGAVATNSMTTGGGAGATVFASAGGGAAVGSVTRPFAGNILDATNTETRFLETTGTAGFSTSGLTFKITTAATGTVTFSYSAASPDIRQKQFNNLTNLAASINEVTGLSARVVGNQLYVGATDANAAVTFENGSTVGIAGPPLQSGVDWIRELGLQNIVTGSKRFSTLQGLYNLATVDAGISASIENPLGASTLKINVDDPLDNISFADSATRTALTAFTSATPFSTTAGSRVVTVTHPAAHAFTDGDFVTLNATALANTQTLTTVNPATITSGANPTVTVNVTGAGQTYSVGQLITIAGAANLNGANINGTWAVSAVSGSNVSFVATGQTSAPVVVAVTNPITTTIATNPLVTLNYGSTPPYVAGQSITISGAANVNGGNINGTWTVASVSGNNITFTATGVTTSGVAAAGGGAAVAITSPTGGGAAVTAAYGSFNGIPLANFSGRYEITTTGATTYQVTLNAAATASGSTGAAGLLVTPHNNLGSVVAELGLVASLNGAAYTPRATTSFGPAYSPTNTALNMASGNVKPQFSRPIRIYDAQGGGHDLNMAFLKTDVNTWAIEVYAVPETDVSSSLPDGLVAYGNVQFNGDGTLNSIDNTLTQAAAISWTNGAAASSVNFDWGIAGQPFGTVGATTFGQANGLSQFNAAYKVSFANQNGAPVGELTGVSITAEGLVVASYSNGETQSLYKIPLADFANPNELEQSSGNVYSQSADSGQFNLRQAGTSGVGKIASASLEASNVELSAELTDMIVAQRSYQANAKVISTSDNMLEELNRIIN